MKTVYAVAVVIVMLMIPGVAAGSEEVLCRNQKSDEYKFRKACKADETKVVVVEADEAMMKECKYLGHVQASSAWGGLFAQKGASNAHKSVVRQAAQKGATHIVWSILTGRVGGASASAKAYQCGAPRATKPARQRLLLA